MLKLSRLGAGAENYFEASVPDDQKARKNTLKSVRLAVEKLDQALNDLDSEAMGYLYAHLVDGLAVSGVQLSAEDNKMTSMLNEHFRAVVEGGEMRKAVRGVAATIVEATTRPASPCPNMTTLQTNRAVEWPSDGTLHAGTSIAVRGQGTGFAVQCLRAMFELAGIEVEKPGTGLRRQ